MATPQNFHGGHPSIEDDRRRVAAPHRRNAANRRIPRAPDPEPEPEPVPEGQANDTDTTEEYEGDHDPNDGAGEGGEILSDEDGHHWAIQNQAEGDQDLDVEIHDEEADPGEEYEYEEMEDTAPVFDPAALGLKEINNLAHFSVSSHKPGNGVAELLSDDLDKYWQSDGQQPHLLTMHFLRRVEIRAIRFYVDYIQDESYTPIHVIWHAGTGHHDLMQFGEQSLVSPSGWQDVEIEGLGGGHDGNSLCCFIVQMHIKENHQNGKDTHIRGIKIYALDDTAVRREGGLQLGEIADYMEAATLERAATAALPSSSASRALRGVRTTATMRPEEDDIVDEESGDNGPALGHNAFSMAGLSIPDFMRKPEIR